MPTIELPWFGKLDTGSLEEYYEQENVEIEGMAIDIDLNFENNAIEEERLIATRKFLEQMPKWIAQNRKYIQDNIKDEDDDTIREYADYLVEVLSEDELAQLIDADDDTEDRTAWIAGKLQLVRVGLYPDSAQHFAIFDYTIGRQLVDYLVVINTDENGQLDYMTMES